MTWTLAVPLYGKESDIADIKIDTSKDQVTIKSLVDDTMIVVNCSWGKFARLVTENGYHINYATNTIVTSHTYIEPNSDRTDFEVIFEGVDWYFITRPASLMERVQKFLYDTYAWCAAITF